MAKNGTINKTTFTDTSALKDTSELKVKAIHVTELQKALEQLNTYGANVDNCGNCTFARPAKSAKPARDARARNASPVPAKPVRASASAARETAPARREGNVTATALVATVTVRMIREEGHKMASQNEIVWKRT